jgi:hypothetical protein
VFALAPLTRRCRLAGRRPRPCALWLLSCLARTMLHARTIKFKIQNYYAYFVEECPCTVQLTLASRPREISDQHQHSTIFFTLPRSLGACLISIPICIDKANRALWLIHVFFCMWGLFTVSKICMRWRSGPCVIFFNL